MDRPLSPNLHHPDKPHWAAAPLEVANNQTISGKSTNHELAASWKSTKAHRHRGNRSRAVNSSSRGARRNSRTSLNPEDKRHEPPPQHKGNRNYNRPVSDSPLFERLSGPSKAWANNSGGDNDDTDTSTFETQDWDCGPSTANNTRSNTSLGYSDVGAYQELSNDWVSTSANSWNDIPNATHVLLDDTYQQAPYKSGPDRLGRHVILPHTVDTIPEQRRTSHRVHKQQVSDLNTATLRYLGKGSTTSDLGSQRTSSSSDWDVETAENSDGTLDKRFHRLSCSVAHNSILSQRDAETFDEEALTPKLRSDTYPFRDIQTQTINSPQIAPATPYCYSFDSKLELSLAPQHQENHTLSNTFHGSASDWLPVQHTAEDWLPPQASKNLASTQRPHLVNASDVYAPLKPTTDGNAHDVTRNASPSYPLGRESHPNHSNSTNWFGGPSAQDLSLGNGPRPDNKLSGYTWRSRESLPAQTEVFAQYLAETYHSSKNNGRGRGWRAGGRGTRGSSTSCAHPCRNPYGPRNYPEGE